MAYKFNHDMHACFAHNYPEALSHCGHGHDLISVAQVSVISIADIRSAFDKTLVSEQFCRNAVDGAPLYPTSIYCISVRSRLSRHSSRSSQVQTLPRLPPVISSHLDKKEFSFSTLADIKHSQKLQDAVVVEHFSSNPTCRCAMCMLHESATASVAGVQQGEQQRACRDTKLYTKFDKHF